MAYAVQHTHTHTLVDCFLVSVQYINYDCTLLRIVNLQLSNQEVYMNIIIIHYTDMWHLLSEMHENEEVTLYSYNHTYDIINVMN